MTANEKQCENCRFYNSKSSVWETGECRFNAPLPTLKPVMLNDKIYKDATLNWPPVKPTDFCGQHKEKT